MRNRKRSAEESLGSSIALWLLCCFARRNLRQALLSAVAMNVNRDQTHSDLPCHFVSFPLATHSVMTLASRHRGLQRESDAIQSTHQWRQSSLDCSDGVDG